MQDGVRNSQRETPAEKRMVCPRIRLLVLLLTHTGQCKVHLTGLQYHPLWWVCPHSMMAGGEESCRGQHVLQVKVKEDGFGWAKVLVGIVGRMVGFCLEPGVDSEDGKESGCYVQRANLDFSTVMHTMMDTHLRPMA